MKFRYLVCSIIIFSLDFIDGSNAKVKDSYDDVTKRPHHDQVILTNSEQNSSHLQNDNNLNTNNSEIARVSLTQRTSDSIKEVFPGKNDIIRLNNTEIETQVGGKITLRCYTGNFSDEVVTWIKREDDQLLTIGQELYANENRFSASFSHQTKSWELFIKDVELSDAGQYECQVTTHPPIIFIYTLLVKRARAVIVGPKEVHIEEGSKLDIQCYVENSPSPPVYIFWYHNGTMVNYNRERGLQVHIGNFSSNLMVKRVTHIDAGIYSCNPNLATNSTILIHVNSLETPAAMQHELNTNGCENCSVVSINIALALFMLTWSF